MNTNIIIPGKIQAAQPKPTKSQLVEALLDQARKEHKELCDRNLAKKEELRVLLKKEALRLLKAVKPAEMELDERQYGENDQVELAVIVMSREIQNIKSQIRKFNCSRFDEDEMKKKIREGLTPANPLLSNPDMAAPLAQLLARIMGTKTIEV
jgi:hypothetical protein